MKRVWKEQDIIKALKQMAKAAPKGEVFERVWFKLEERIETRKNYFWNNLVWRPFNHPVRWVVAACLCLAFTGFLLQRMAWMDNDDMARYLMTISNSTSTDNVTRDLGLVNVSVLLSEPSVSTADLLKSDDDHTDILSGDEILL